MLDGVVDEVVNQAFQQYWVGADHQVLFYLKLHTQRVDFRLVSQQCVIQQLL
ncbi:hypothetical protein D3C78_1637120 [compost metagenome]